MRVLAQFRFANALEPARTGCVRLCILRRVNHLLDGMVLLLLGGSEQKRNGLLIFIGADKESGWQR